MKGTADESPKLLSEYAATRTGRAILDKLAGSIEVANSRDPASWAITTPKNGNINLCVGHTNVLVLRDGAMDIMLIPDHLGEDVLASLSPKRIKKDWFKEMGGHRYRSPPEFIVARWSSIERAHHHAVEKAVQRAHRAPEHSPAVIDFLNHELDLKLPHKLPQPAYYDPPPTDDDTNPWFDGVIESLQAAGLRFSREVVANYVLALQTKRFAILTGISGTGKTRIAMGVAKHFQSSISKIQTGIPDEAVEVTVQSYHLDHHNAVLPATLARRMKLETGPGSRRLRIRYPGGPTELTYWQDERENSLSFSGEFRRWFDDTFEAGDQFWYRILEGKDGGDDGLEIGLPRTSVVEDRTHNREVVPVRPDWVDNRGLLGFFNPLTEEYSPTPFLSLLLEAREEKDRAERERRHPLPFFIILDEMNLARVEHYFSDFLSALESGEPIPLHDDPGTENGKRASGIPVPRKLVVPDNVFFTGTVNVDETTYMFSPKVLDRAFTIELDLVDLEGHTTGFALDETSGLKLDSTGGELRLTPYRKPGRYDWVAFSKLNEGRLHQTLLELHAILEKEHRHFGYRVANEIARFVNLAGKQSTDQTAAVTAAFDLALLQKVLPKFHGTQQELEELLKRLFNFVVHGGGRRGSLDGPVRLEDWKVVEGRLQAASASPEAASVPAFPRTAAKIRRMLRRLEQRGFTSFIE